MKPRVLAAVALLSGACAAGPPSRPQTLDVRLDIVTRALAAAADGGPPDEPTHTAITRAYRALYDAELAVVALKRGDGRPWARARPCLAYELERVEAALLDRGVLPPPGLTQTIPRAPLEACADERGEAP